MKLRSETLRRLRFGLGNCSRFLAGTWMDTNVAVDRMCTIFGIRFTGGHHHLTETIKRYQHDPRIDYRDTPLRIFLEKFRPTSTQSAMGLETSGKPLDLFSYPWGTFDNANLVSDKQAQYSRFCGPSTDDFIRQEFERTIALYRQIRDLGYRPYEYPHSFVGGVWLISREKEKVFVVLQGNHRVSALVCCGLKKLDVRPLRKNLWTINEADLPEWPLVKAGICSPDSAAEVFAAFFRDNGPRVTDRLNRH